MPTQDEIQQKIDDQYLSDAAGRVASAAPLPGPSFDAFAKTPPIKIGQFSIREFCDADFESLQILKNPLIDMIEVAYQSGQVSEAELSKQETAILKQVMRGRFAWDICFLLTNPPEYADEILSTKGAEAFQKLAKKAFGTLSLGQIQQVAKAAIDQMTTSWATRIALEPFQSGGTGDNGEAAPSTANPP